MRYGNAYCHRLDFHVRAQGKHDYLYIGNVAMTFEGMKMGVKECRVCVTYADGTTECNVLIHSGSVCTVLCLLRLCLLLRICIVVFVFFDLCDCHSVFSSSLSPIYLHCEAYPCMLHMPLNRCCNTIELCLPQLLPYQMSPVVLYALSPSPIAVPGCVETT
jgi:hypothetical protein